MIVCLDTNVFVSGVLWKGPPSRILERWINNEFEVIVSPEILSEYELVLRRFEKKMPWEELLVWIDFAKSHSRLIAPKEWPEIACRDSTDLKFLTCSLEGHANYLITGDQDLLSLKNQFPFKIIQPPAFLKLLQ